MTVPLNQPPTHPGPSASGPALLVCDANGDLLVCNQAGEHLVGSDDGTAKEEAHGENATAVVDFLTLVLHGEKDMPQQELELRDPASGDAFPVTALGLRIPDHAGRVWGALAVLSLAPMPNTAHPDRYGAGQGIDPGGFPSAPPPSTEGYLCKTDLEVVSHELRTPINAVVGYATLLHERLLGDLSEDQERAVRRIEAAAQQLLAAVNHALLLAHIDVGDFEAGDFARRRGSGRSPRKHGPGNIA